MKTSILDDYVDTSRRIKIVTTPLAHGVSLLRRRFLTGCAVCMSGAGLQIVIVDDNELKQVAASPAAVRQAIERQLKDAALFTDACRCVRMDEK